ncbi:MAG: glycosyltransferase family 4 protein [Pseudonocardiales bacterium]
MRSPHVLIVVQNLPVPLDRRVWLECQALCVAGYEVSVICPKGPGDPAYEFLDGVHLYKYRPPPPASGTVSYLVEFGYCWLRTAWLTLRVARRRRFAVLQACNPPDTYWALAALWRPLGVRFVFDHHDLNPEVFRSRFGEPAGLAARLQLRGLRWLERRTFRTATHVISTNESYRRVALDRGGLPLARTTVVRSGPDTGRMRPVDEVRGLRCGARYLLVYLGIMGPQDGVDVVLRALDVLVHRMGRDDVHVALLGFGDSYDELVALAGELGLREYVTFTGRADLKMITEFLSSADVGLSPDPRNPLNDLSTMNKTMEYMAFALPVVAFDLTETRVSGGDAAVYVDPDGPDAVERFAVAVAALLDDPDQRARMALAGRRRAERVLDWQPQRAAYVGVFDRLTGWSSTLSGHTGPPGTGTNEWGHELVDVTDDAALLTFAVRRRIPVRPDTRVVHHNGAGDAVAWITR